ncbi:hypothetical protein K710_0310 [Streptococcus iniae SF1]|nr:hypothetical protein K710_0310 [Streptococcus iniae SF1]
MLLRFRERVVGYLTDKLIENVRKCLFQINDLVIDNLVG